MAALNPYLGVVLLLAVSAGFLVFMLILSSILGPQSHSRTKDIPFECGSVSVGDVQRQRFNVRFYLIAVLFILFDVEVVFMYPWAVALHKAATPGAGWFLFFEMLTFVLILAVGLVYVWRKGVLDWND